MSPQSKSFGEKLMLILASAVVSAVVSLWGSSYASAKQGGADKERLDATSKQVDVNTNDIKSLQSLFGEVKAMRSEISAIYGATVTGKWVTP